MSRPTVHLSQGRTAMTACPNCGKEQDAYTAVNEQPRRPEPGDAVMCAYCAALNVYGGGMVLRPMDPDIRDEYLETHPLARIVRAQLLQKIAAELTGKK